MGSRGCSSFSWFFGGRTGVFREGAAPVPNKNQDGAKGSEFTPGRRKHSQLRNFHGMGPDLGPEGPVALPSLWDGIPGCSQGRKEGREGGRRSQWDPGTPPDPGWPGLEKSAPGCLCGDFFPSLFPGFPWFYPWISGLSLLWWDGAGRRSLRIRRSWNSGIPGLGAAPIPIPSRDSLGPQGSRISPKESSHGAKDIPARFSKEKSWIRLIEDHSHPNSWNTREKSRLFSHWH